MPSLHGFGCGYPLSHGRANACGTNFPGFSPRFGGKKTFCSSPRIGEAGVVSLKVHSDGHFVVLPGRIELTTSPLPRECSTTELRQHALGPDRQATRAKLRSAQRLKKAWRSLPQRRWVRKRPRTRFDMISNGHAGAWIPACPKRLCAVNHLGRTGW